MKKLLSGFVVFLAIIFISCDGPYIPTPTTTYFAIGGTIRPYSGSWDFIDDTAHSPINVSHVETRHDCILIWYSESVSVVNSFMIEPDEVFAQEQIDVGASVGLDWAAIYLFKDGVQLDPTTISSQWGNLWFAGLFEK